MSDVALSLARVSAETRRARLLLASSARCCAALCLAAALEALSLYVDLGQRKVAEFEDEKIKIMDDYIEKNKSDFNNKDLKFSSKLKK
mgnify:CR=1 FL=1